ncbi:MAG: hypothetical protein LUH14_02030 [Clostridiaceae bacterium]|nr:hypothetical protein [Clostridiaceae bacterium]
MGNFRQNPAFQAMDPQKQEMILLLMERLMGKQLSEALPVLTQWNRQMQKEGISFSASEQQMLTDLFMAQMTPEQKKQYDIIKTATRSVRR